MDYLSSIAITLILLIIVFIVILIIALRIFKDSKIDTIEIFQQHLTSMSQENVLQVMFPTTKQTINTDIINCNAFLTDICRTDITIQNTKINRDRIKNILSGYINTQQSTKLTDKHSSYLSNISNTNLRNRTLAAAILEQMCSNVKPNIVIKESIIHELISCLHQGCFFSISYKIINSIFNKGSEEDPNYIVRGRNTNTSIKIKNSHIIICDIKNDILINDKGNVDTAKYILTSKLTFSISSNPKNSYSPISYKDIKLTLHFPKNMRQYITSEKPVRNVQENLPHTVLVKKSRNTLVYQLPSFTSNSILLEYYNKLLQNAESIQPLEHLHH
ncbi:hypothetical protein ECHHL_0766 [Ehrlichia chaffeensis str. Heartland]|uniref:ECH_0866 family protein n=1 Tax=Ehrlichia chaffeensis TaxID=945 RepID=UPI000053A2D4|nr:hypothetical protein [Ehrlichia chaffeensis]AHX03911.1 hypothetical protein ECHHL_0766 [Ehrlichia chaffeensis str. Heartland]AHX10841.1 hypothetical protein ECHWP_0762 [Ehrlichia chaffeensis str. West Paces]